MGRPMKIIIFRIWSQTRLVTIFRTTVPMTKLSELSHVVKLIQRVYNRLHSYIGEHLSDFARRVSSSKGWLRDLHLGRLPHPANYSKMNEAS